MPSWNEIVTDVQKQGDSVAQFKHLNNLRKDYIADLSKFTGRNVIAYYSAFLSSPNHRRTTIIDEDMNGFMNAIYGMDRTKGLDLILHTPGGEICATEALGNYLVSMFGNNIRVIIPQIAMSGGTMLSCLGTEIIMGKHSSIGPIDPQINGVPAHGIKLEFEMIKDEIKKNPAMIVLYREILSKYHPTFILMCEQAITLSEEVASRWLKNSMFKKNKKKDVAVKKILKILNSTDNTLVHARHFGPTKAKEIGLKIYNLEKNNDLQEKVLSIHHAITYTFSMTNSLLKIIDNNLGKSYIFQSPEIQQRPGISIPIQIPKQKKIADPQ